MDKIYTDNLQNYCDALQPAIEKMLPDCRVTNLGNQLLIMMKNKSVASLYPLSDSTCDIFAKDSSDRDWDLKDQTMEEGLTFLGQMASIPVDEETSTSNVQGASSAKAFTNPNQRSPNRATLQSKREGWTQLGEDKQRDQSGRKKSSDYPFGEDSLGAN